MNKKVILSFGILLISINVYAKTKGSVTVGSELIENDASEEGKVLFGGAYTNFNITAENEYVTAGGKLYYRLNSTDSIDGLGQKLEIKKALLKVRPLGDNSIEFAIGKLYSYYLPGNFFQLSEIYTGASRWGKTGVGFVFNKEGLSVGGAIPLTESYVNFSDGFGLNGAVVYDLKTVNADLPVKLGADLLYSAAKQGDAPLKNDFSSTVTALFTPSLKGLVSKVSVAASFSYNAEPFVASSVFKNVSNYKNADLKKSNFGSINASANVGKIQLTLEGEAGHSTKGSIVPLYAGTQVVVPVTEKIALRPKFFYYAALDSQDKSAGRQTFEIYPRVWITTGDFVISAGYDFDFKQVSASDWNFEWSVPLFVEYKLGK